VPRLHGDVVQVDDVGRPTGIAGTTCADIEVALASRRERLHDDLLRACQTSRMDVAVCAMAMAITKFIRQFQNANVAITVEDDGQWWRKQSEPVLLGQVT
jgi:hypothetical protein